jgi:putative Ca2+/H+ antiporter (TMEM165/GDT1 family)
MEPRAESAAGGVGAGNGDGDGGFKDAFLSSVSMILVSEMGDETFIIAAIMAMRHPRVVVFSGAIAALSIMTVLGVALGLVVPNLISKDTVSKAAFVLYTFFGCRLLYIAWKADPAATMQEEVSEVEEKLGGGLGPKPPAGPLRRALNRVCTPIFLEAFILTFLAEWGDRSQIATIGLAASEDPFGVTLGGVLGHAVCTGAAVLGGKHMATLVSERAVAITGGALFVLFGTHALVTGVEE